SSSERECSTNASQPSIELPSAHSQMRPHPANASRPSIDLPRRRVTLVWFFGHTNQLKPHINRLSNQIVGGGLFTFIDTILLDGGMFDGCDRDGEMLKVQV